MASPKPHTTTVGDNEITVWGDPTLVDQFFGLTPDVDAGPTNVQFDRPATTRRRYPGDTAPVSVSANSAVYSLQAARQQSTTPGRAFTVEVESGEPPNKTVTVYQFTLEGAWRDLRTLADGSFPEGTYLRSPNGKPVEPVAAT